MAERRAGLSGSRSAKRAPKRGAVASGYYLILPKPSKAKRRKEIRDGLGLPGSGPSRISLRRSSSTPVRCRWGCRNLPGQSRYRSGLRRGGAAQRGASRPPRYLRQ